MKTLPAYHAHHPIRACLIHSYVGETGAIAIIGDGKKTSFPYFRAPTREQAIEKAQAFQNQVIAEHEEKFVRRQEAAAKAKARNAA